MTPTEPVAGQKRNLTLGDIRDILIIVAIFLFFTGWIYLHYFYDYFGLSVSLLSINYSDYLVYSYTVFISYYGLPALGILLLLYVYERWLKKYLPLGIFLAVLLFPSLYLLARNVASDNALKLSKCRGVCMRHISFVFNQETGFVAGKSSSDSLKENDSIVKSDLANVTNTDIDNNRLYLLGQNQDYYFVLFQPPNKYTANTPPQGIIYYVKKSYVLYAKIKT